MVGHGALQIDPKLSKTIAKLKELKVDKIEVSALIAENGLVKIVGYAKNSRIIPNYLRAIEDGKIGLVHLKEITPAERNGEHIYHFILSVDALDSELEDIFPYFQNCNFRNFYYAPWDTSIHVHPYFAERNLKPFKEDNGVYYFRVQDSLFGLPVSEIIVPGTWDFHAIVFDVPLDKARKVFKKRFGTAYFPSDKSKKGESPALDRAIEIDQTRLPYIALKVKAAIRYYPTVRGSE